MQSSTIHIIYVLNKIFLLTEGWHNIELTFTPYQLSHTEVVNDGNVDIIFLLSGSDRRVHMFKEVRLKPSYIVKF